MTRSVVIIGAGAAGLAAAWSARREGRDVTVILGRAGASSLGGGAVDDIPWERLVVSAKRLGVELRASELPADVVELSRALGLWTLAEAQAPRPRLATVAGRIRPARGHDRALLDLAELAKARIILPRVDRAGWDADAIAAALSDDPFARERGISFEPADLPVLRFDDEHRVPDADLAARHDDEDRLDWLAMRIHSWVSRAASSGEPIHGVLLGPWLGAQGPRAEELSAKVGVRVGEALVGAGSPAGLRFDAARDQLLKTLGAQIVRDHAIEITPERGRISIALERASNSLVTDAVILATGGLVGGGVTYLPSESLAAADLPPRGRVPFELSVRAPVTLSLGSGAALGVTSSLHGPELDLSAWPTLDQPGALEAVGVACDGVRAAPQIGAAGDVIAGRPRTLLEAITSGLRAGREI